MNKVEHKEHVSTPDLTISASDVVDFKLTYCDENPKIRDILIKEFSDSFDESILDVGSGIGDILSDVIPDKKVYHLDVGDFSAHQIPEKHVRVQGDFLNAELVGALLPVNTLFMSHVQQFIDRDLKKLKAAIERIKAKKIILVEDLNNDFLGEVAEFSLKTFKGANPEIKIDGFPFGYNKTKSAPFTANLVCASFDELTKQCLYLMDIKPSADNFSTMRFFLLKTLAKPQFTINQEINLYEK